MPTKQIRFHNSLIRNKEIKTVFSPSTVNHYTQITKERNLNYDFYSHFHPFASRLMNRLIEGSVPGLQKADTEYQVENGALVRFPNNDPDPARRDKPKPVLFEDFFETTYAPNPKNINDLITKPYPVKELDFAIRGAYSVYNWELFFHVPLTLAIHLSKNGRYAEAQQWFHYIFDPTDNSDGPTPERFWKVKPFQTTDIKLIETVMVNLSTGEDQQLREDTINAIMAWKENPFRPHVVARYRPSSYMFKTVFAYIDNLIAWGDADFRKDQPEDVDAALLKYVLAANILGPKPQAVPPRVSVQPQTYQNLRDDLDEFSNTMRRYETEIPFNLLGTPAPTNGQAKFELISSLGTTLYFSIPRNPRLMEYWNTVADRLFKIRNSLNFQGVFRQLPLFAPPIDPALLARATAAGLDIDSVISGLYAPLPGVRFNFLIQKATEICQEVKSLGASLLSAMEKEDNEALAIMRAHHEKMILSMTESVKYAQWQEAIKNRESLLTSFQNAAQRYGYYERQLGKKEADIKLPEITELEKEGLIKFNLQAKEELVKPRDLAVNIATDLGDARGKLISSFEAEELKKLNESRDLQNVVQGIKLGGQAISLLPQFGIKFHFWGLGGDTNYGGFNLGKVAKFASEVAAAVADYKNFEAANASKVGGYDRREADWGFQSNSAAGEINQIYKQIRAAQIREAMAEIEYKNHQQQIKNAEEVELFLSSEQTGKKTNQALYTWLKKEIKGLYNQCFQFAFDVARKAERALQQELGDKNQTFIQYNYTSGKEGLLAGEKLYMDLKRMEMAYYDQNHREYELTKHVSLLQLSPTALLQLRTTGRCSIAFPEELFDMDGPGHYCRRLKGMAVTFPCLTGPYTQINCTLTQTKSSIRKSAVLGDGYPLADNDERLETSFGSQQSIVTSTAQNDSGMFEFNLRDERKLPFEYSGAISEWQLTLPGRDGGIKQFNYDTISDVIFHIRYTAREGGEVLRKAAVQNINDKITEATAAGTTRLFSVRHEFPNEWDQFKSATIDAQHPFVGLNLTIKEEHYPFWAKGSVRSVKEVMMFAKSEKNSITIQPAADDNQNADRLEKAGEFGDLRLGKLTNNVPAAPTGPITLFLDDNSMSDLWISVNWTK